MGGMAHIYGQAVAKALGIEMKYIGAGGIPHQVAALKGGTADALLTPATPSLSLVVRGEMRRVLTVRDYLPREWSDAIIFARKNPGWTVRED